MVDGDEDTGGKHSLGLSGRMTLLTHTGRKEMTDHGPAYSVQHSLIHSLCLRKWEMAVLATHTLRLPAESCLDPSATLRVDIWVVEQELWVSSFFSTDVRIGGWHRKLLRPDAIRPSGSLEGGHGKKEEVHFWLSIDLVFLLSFF